MLSLRRFMLALHIAAFTGSAGAAAQTAGSGVPSPASPTVVELFTSQGCSSCPPSDQQLGELAKRSDLLPLSLHVDYWDYIGWKDPFASPVNTERQRGYARSLKQRYVYTPEMVVGGLVHDPGYDQAKVGKMLRMAAERSGPRAHPALARAAGNGIAVTLPETHLTTPCDVWLVTFDRQHRTDVARGENKGATLVNHNVVRSLEKLATWNGEAARWTVPAERVGLGQSVAVVVQQASFGPIIGASRLDR
jgi:hypothetical protein